MGYEVWDRTVYRFVPGVDEIVSSIWPHCSTAKNNFIVLLGNYIFFQHEKISLDKYISILVYQLVIALVHI